MARTGAARCLCKAVAKIDECLARIVPAVTERGGTIAITADHGNSEQLWDPSSDQPHTAHTLNPVPIIFCSEDLVGTKMRERGLLADVAPSLLEILNLPKSSGMDGVSLFA